MLTSQLLTVLLLASTSLPPLSAWSGEDFYFQPNSTSLNLSLVAPLELEAGSRAAGARAGGGQLASPSSRCNITVLRLVATSLLARWERSLGFTCDVLLFTTNSNARSFFSAAFTRVFPPVTIEHVGVGGAQQEFKLCVGCGGSPTPQRRRAGPRRRKRRTPPGQGQRVNFCCLDFSLEELRWDKGWSLTRKPIESTLVACFMTIVIIIWSVAALIWPVPIIAGFLPNGMEQRRG
ncbi:transmembrane protein 158 [Scyliorhinus canicula]|uniref:transmembrane protein 158 n=1 Tax=Scyliorhinus canicula TaxID=7830 RepID=UPI0018F426B7|nr:transmembrane protein 158 [Scyliorhinus canicula]